MINCWFFQHIIYRNIQKKTHPTKFQRCIHSCNHDNRNSSLLPSSTFPPQPWNWHWTDRWNSSARSDGKSGRSVCDEISISVLKRVQGKVDILIFIRMHLIEHGRRQTTIKNGIILIADKQRLTASASYLNPWSLWMRI